MAQPARPAVKVSELGPQLLAAAQRHAEMAAAAKQAAAKLYSASAVATPGGTSGSGAASAPSPSPIPKGAA